jgi:hypothetical protein
VCAEPVAARPATNSAALDRRPAPALEAMRDRAAELAPDSTAGIWRSNERFFRAGGRGEWRDFFTEHTFRRYNDRAGQLAARDLLAWAHDGRRGHDPG